MDPTRREWLANCMAAAAWAATAVNAATPPPFRVLDASTAADIDAVAAQIIPSSDGPGAREAGVVYFIDRALATFDSDRRTEYREGMREIGKKRAELFPNSASIAALTGEQQVRLMKAIESSHFFELLRTHTVLGFLCNPSYGGNRDSVGWQHIGFEHRMSFAPPFGYYDDPAHRERE